ncbi:MAG: hypothetical protein ACE5FJ_02635 [Gemmatimonadales bacterium]
MTRATAALALALAACSRETGENSAICGITHLASANAVMQQANTVHRILFDPPEGLDGIHPARAVGYGTGSVLVATTEDGLLAGFQGQGFPQIPGFGVVLMDDSAEVFRGVIVYDLEVPENYPQIGTISDDRLTIPLLGLRVYWAAVNDERCPLFTVPDTVTGDPV